MSLSVAFPIDSDYLACDNTETVAKSDYGPRVCYGHWTIRRGYPGTRHPSAPRAGQ